MVRREKLSQYLDRKIPVLDKGYVELCDYLGDDETVVCCASQSYGKVEGDLMPEFIDRRIKEMIIAGHTSPFEQVVFQFHLRMPIFVQRQWCRHRTARMNELSGRYSKFSKDDFYIPNDSVLACRKTYSKIIETEDSRGYKDKLTDKIIGTISENNDTAYARYESLYDESVPKEIARETLPLTLFTEFYWQMDLHNLLHFLELRMEEHAQKEIREYASIIYKVVESICPITIKYFTQYKLNSLTLGQEEIETLKVALTMPVFMDTFEEQYDRLACIISNAYLRNNERMKYLNDLNP
jgi:thymidylate synthase (FAD)